MAKRTGTDAPEHNPNENAVRFLHTRISELLGEIAENGFGELNIKVTFANSKIQYIEFNPTERYKMT